MGGGSSFVQPEEDAMRGTMVKRTTNLSTAANNNVIDFDTEVYDDDGVWTVGTPSRLTIPALYNGKRAVFHAECIWTGNTNNSYRELKIFKNGDTSEPISVAQDAPNSSNTGVQLTSHPYVLATADYFELCARAGGTETALAAEEYSITFSIEVRMS
jgi:hypothetical protein